MASTTMAVMEKTASQPTAEAAVDELNSTGSAKEVDERTIRGVKVSNERVSTVSDRA